MSYGLTEELVNLGKGKRPPERSQLGACLPCAAAAGMLGEVGTVRPGYCWIAATATVPGHWERVRAGQTAPCVQVEGAVVVRGGSSVTVTETATGKVVAPIAPPRAAPAPPADQVFANIGPFMIPVSVGAWRDHRALTAEKRAYVDENIAIAAKAGGISIAEMKKGRYPFVKFKAGPTGQESWGLYCQENDGTQKTSRGSVIPAGVVISYHKIPAGEASQLGGVIGDIGGALKDVAQAVGGAVWSVLKKVWKGIKWVVMKVVHFVVDAAKWVAKMTCKLHPAWAVKGAQAVAAAAPNPYTVAVAAGATLTKMICDKVYGSDEGKAAAQAAAEAEAQAAAAEAERLRLEQEAAERRKKMMPILLLGGAGVLAAVLLLGKKK
jgi:hypothetical protein